MPRYPKYGQINLGEPSRMNQVGAERARRFSSNKLKLFKRLHPVKELPSFLIRTLHDYAVGRTRLSAFQSRVIQAWERAKLNRSNARQCVERLYACEDDLFPQMEERIFSVQDGDLDVTIGRALAEADWRSYFESNALISPIRLAESLHNRTIEGLNVKERLLISDILASYGDSVDLAGMTNESSRKISRLIVRPPSRFVLSDRKGRRAIAITGIDEATGGLVDVSQLFEEDERTTPTCRDWRCDRLGHRIVTYDEATGDDPVFVYSAFRISETASPSRIVGPEVYKPADDEKHDNFRESFKNIFPGKTGDDENNFFSDETNLLVVNAWEDDQWFSDDTEKYIDFGLDLSQQICALDPTGVSETIIGIIEVAWDIVKILDWLDDDDYVGENFYSLGVDQLPQSDDAYPWSEERDLVFGRESNSTWLLRIRSGVETAITF